MDGCEAELLPPRCQARRSAGLGGPGRLQGKRLPAARSPLGTRPGRNGTVSPIGPLYLADREQLLTSRFARISEGEGPACVAPVLGERSEPPPPLTRVEAWNRPGRREGRGDSCTGAARWAGGQRALGQLTGSSPRPGLSRGHCHPTDRGRRTNSVPGHGRAE